MTQLPPRPSIGYYLGHLPPERRDKALAAIADAGWDIFEWTMKGALDGLGLRKEPPRQRLDFYDAKPSTIAEANERVMLYQEWQAAGAIGVPPPGAIPNAFSWEEQQTKDPTWYGEDMRDWERLVQRSLDEDWDGLEEPV